MKNTLLLMLLLLFTYTAWVQTETEATADNQSPAAFAPAEESAVTFENAAVKRENKGFENAAFYEQLISGFTLVNAASDVDLFPVADGDVISLSSLPSVKLTIRANTSPEVVGSVKLELTGPVVRTYIDNGAPYSIFGDDNISNYYFGSWSPPPVGTYTLKVTPYTLSSGKGTAGTSSTITFTIVQEGTPPADQTAPQVSSINRQEPLEQQTSATQLTYRLTFTEGVTGVDATDFALTTTETAAATISSVTAVSASTYDVGLTGVTGTGTLRLDLKATGTAIADAAGNALSGGYSNGQLYSVAPGEPDPTPEQYNLTINTDGHGAVIKNPDEPAYDFGSNVSITAVPSSGYEFAGWSGDVSGSTNPVNILIDGNKSLQASFTATTTTTQSITDFILVNASADNDLQPITDGAVISLASLPTTKLSIRVNTSPSTVGSVKFVLTGPSSRNYTDNNLPYSLFGDDGIGNFYYGVWNPPPLGTYTLTATPYTLSSGGGTAGTARTISFTIVENEPPANDNTPPTVLSINRFSPSTQNTSVTSVIFRTTFSEPVTGVNIADFSLHGTASGTIASVSGSGSVYDVNVNSITGTGSLGIDLKASGTGITDASGNAIASGFTTGQTYNIEQTQTLVGFKTITRLSDLTITSNSTGEKPQSKVWIHAGRHWAILANSNGTYLWRLDGTSWTNILRLSTRTSSKADCKVVGDITHIFLYQGRSSQLVSVEYDAENTTYKMWSKRSSTVGISLDNGVETATIDIDGTGRMWLANAGTTSVYVRYSDAPYSNWSSPVTIATGVTDDDICAVIALPGKIGVLWSNQNSERFGFKTHTDGDSPNTWSTDEVPASQSALNVGHGMADDHMNMVAASDGTLYCAVKTSYDLSGYPKIALLIRRTNGSWDDLYTVSNHGTRPIVVLNEVLGKIRIIYPESESGGNLYYHETKTSSISFSPEIILINGSAINNPTSVKQAFDPEVVIVGSSSSKAISVLASDGTAPTPAIARKITLKEDAIAETGDIKVNPNFVRRGERIYLQSSSNNPADVMVVDAYGRTLNAFKFNSATSIATGNFTNGTYYILITQNNKLKTHKFIVVN